MSLIENGFSGPRTSFRFIESASGSGQLHRAVAKDMVANVRGLVTDKAADFDFILGLINEEVSPVDPYRTRRMSGEGAVARNIAPSMASLMHGLGLGMDSTEAVYLSADFFVTKLDEKLEGMQRRLLEIETGVRNFLTEEQKMAASGGLQKTVSIVAGQLGILKPRVDEFAEANFDQTDLYTKVLHHLLFNLHRHFNLNKRRKVFALLRTREIEGAYRVCFPEDQS